MYNCYYNGPAIPLKDKKAAAVLKGLCPWFFEKSEEPALCCDTVQIDYFQRTMQLPRQFLSRCPSCWHNFVQLYCQSTCSPDQSLFLDVKLKIPYHPKLAINNTIINNGNKKVKAVHEVAQIDSEEAAADCNGPPADDDFNIQEETPLSEIDSNEINPVDTDSTDTTTAKPPRNESIAAVDYYMTPEFANGLFDACSEVKFPGNNEKVLNVLCADPTGHCTPCSWLKYLGNPNNGEAPFKINPVFTDYANPKTGIIPMNKTTFACNVATGVGIKATCSCQDCPAVCKPLPPIPTQPKPPTIANIRSVLFIVIMIYFSLVAIFILILVVRYARDKIKPGDDANLDDEFSEKIDHAQNSQGKVNYGIRVLKNKIYV